VLSLHYGYCKEAADNIGKVKIIHEVENNPNTPVI
jgi:hypothetical protein